MRRRFKQPTAQFIEFAKNHVINEGWSFTSLGGFVVGGASKLNAWTQVNKELHALREFHFERVAKDRELKRY